MLSRGFAHRQLRILGKSRVDKVSRHYKMGKLGKLVGDSPELCRALDSHGFADLDAALAFSARWPRRTLPRRERRCARSGT